MADPAWNKIDFARWELRDVSIRTNYYSGDDPVWIEIEGNGYDDYTKTFTMSPSEARVLAAKLVEAANAVDQAGRFLKSKEST